MYKCNKSIVEFHSFVDEPKGKPVEIIYATSAKPTLSGSSGDGTL